MKFITIFILFFFLQGLSYSQTSFTKEIIGLEAPQYFQSIFRVTDNGNLSVLFPNSPDMTLVELSAEANITDVFLLKIPDLNIADYLVQHKIKGNYHVVGVPVYADNLFSGMFLVFMVNFVTGEKWVRKTLCTAFARSTFYISPSNSVLVSQFLECENPFDVHFMGLSLLDLQSGNETWSYYYRPESITTGYQFYPDDIKNFPNGDFSVLNRMVKSEDHQSISLSLNRLSIDGVIKKSVVMLGNYDTLRITSHSIDQAGNVYLSGKSFSPDMGYTEGFIAKMDKDYNLLWAKKLRAEGFPDGNLLVKNFPSGDVMFIYEILDDLPVITGKISSQGELLWHRGYSFYRPQAAIGQDEAIYFLSRKKYHTDGTWEWVPMVIKTDENGDIADCEQFDSCLELIDMNLTFTEETWSRFDGPELPSYDLEYEPITDPISTAPYCGTPTPPHPDFSFPDTLCQYSCASPSDLNNRLANHIEWTLSGPGIDTTFADSTFHWCFDTSGTYTIEQEIWLLGCSEFSAQTLEVLPDNLKVSLGEDRTICEQAPYQIIPQGSRPLQTFLWSDSSRTGTLSIPQSGVYMLEATDGYCKNIDTVSLTFIGDFVQETPLVLPPDERTCPALLPYILRPQSPYTSEFHLNNGVKIDSVFSLTQAGIYTVKMEIASCIFSENFQLEIEDCQAPIFLPNSFSPNDDGINDLFFPQGLDYAGIRLQIFNRWGDLVFETGQAPFVWDGTNHGRALNAGVYVFVFSYFNQLNLTEEAMSGDVLLLP